MRPIPAGKCFTLKLAYIIDYKLIIRRQGGVFLGHTCKTIQHVYPDPEITIA